MRIQDDIERGAAHPPTMIINYRKIIVFLIFVITAYNLIHSNEYTFGLGQASRQNKESNQGIPSIHKQIIAAEEEEKLVSPLDEQNDTKQGIPNSHKTNAVEEEKAVSAMHLKDDTKQDMPAGVPKEMIAATLDLTLDDIKVIDLLKHEKGEPIPINRNCSFPIMPKVRGAKIRTSRCCIGAISAGGHQLYRGNINTVCTQNITAYDKVRDIGIVN